MEHETDYQRARRQRHEVKKYGITGSTPKEASKRIKEHTKGTKDSALKQAMTGKTSRTRAMKHTRNFENLRPQGGKTHDILKKLE